MAICTLQQGKPVHWRGAISIPVLACYLHANIPLLDNEFIIQIFTSY